MTYPPPHGCRFGFAAGFFIGVVAAVMGVAGGELLIPTIVLLYAVDIKTAGSLSLAVSFPAMLVACARYSRDGSFGVPRTHRRFVPLMGGGSVLGTVLGGFAAGVVPNSVLIPLLTEITAHQRPQGLEPSVGAARRPCSCAVAGIRKERPAPHVPR